MEVCLTKQQKRVSKRLLKFLILKSNYITLDPQSRDEISTLINNLIRKHPIHEQPSLINEVSKKRQYVKKTRAVKCIVGGSPKEENRAASGKIEEIPIECLNVEDATIKTEPDTVDTIEHIPAAACAEQAQEHASIKTEPELIISDVHMEDDQLGITISGVNSRELVKEFDDIQAVREILYLPQEDNRDERITLVLESPILTEDEIEFLNQI